MIAFPEIAASAAFGAAIILTFATFAVAFMAGDAVKRLAAAVTALGVAALAASLLDARDIAWLLTGVALATALMGAALIKRIGAAYDDIDVRTLDSADQEAP